MNNFILNSIDTDAVAFCRPDMSPFTKEDRKKLIDSLNSEFDENIKFTDDGYFPRFIVLKTKNYLSLDEHGKVTIKGSSLKSSTLEPALRGMLKEMIDVVLYKDLEVFTGELINIYQRYMKMVDNITDIDQWCSKKQLSPTTFNSKRKNETDIIEAIKDSEYKSGDRIYLYTQTKVIETGEFYKKTGLPKTKEVKYLTLKENFKGLYSKDHYLDRVEQTIKRFEPILGKGYYKQIDNTEIK